MTIFLLNCFSNLVYHYNILKKMEVNVSMNSIVKTSVGDYELLNLLQQVKKDIFFCLEIVLKN